MIDPPPGPLWHYTDAAGFMGIISKRYAWATHFAHLNDTGELRFGHDVVSAALDAVDRPANAIGGQILDDLKRRWSAWQLDGLDFYIASFCEDDGNSLSQWRGYGGFGSGYSVGLGWLPTGDGRFKVRYLNPHNVDGDTVAFIREFVAAAAALFNASDLPAHLEMINEIALQHLWTTVMRVKNHGFRDEREWRLLVIGRGQPAEYRATARGLVPYIKVPLGKPDGGLLPLHGVYVGPANSAPAAVAATCGFLRAHGYVEPEAYVKASDIPFRGR